MAECPGGAGKHENASQKRKMGKMLNKRGGRPDKIGYIQLETGLITGLLSIR
jgi:hypothetical protein